MTEAHSTLAPTASGAEGDRPRLRDSVLVFARDADIQFLCLMDLRVKEFRVAPFVHQLAPLLDGTRTRTELLEAVASAPGFTPDAFDAVLTTMQTEKLLVRPVGRGPGNDPSAETQVAPRYERQLRLFEEFIATLDHLPASPAVLQRRLTAARVAVIGTGGAGGWVLQSLAAAGVGSVEILDPDLVETTNLNRQVLFHEADTGTPKVDVAAARLRAANPNVEVRAVRHRVHGVDDLTDTVERADLVINCADEPSVMEMADVVAEAAHRGLVPHIVGGAYGANLGVPGTSVIPGRTVCWACIRHATADDHGRVNAVPLRGRQRSGGSVAPITGLVANIMAWEALRLLLDVPPGLASQVRELDILSLDWRVRAVEPRPDCARCPAAESGPTT